MEQLKNLIKKIVFCWLIASSSQALLRATELPQGPELSPDPGMWSGLRTTVETRAGQLKSAVGAGLSAGWEATKAATTPFLRRQTLKMLNMIIPNSEQQIRTVDDALTRSSSYVTKLRKALAIPEKPSVEELDAQIANLRKELAALKAEFPDYERKKAEFEQRLSAEKAKKRAELERIKKAELEKIDWSLAEKNISQEDIAKALNKQKGQDIKEKLTANSSENKKIEDTIQEIEANKANVEDSTKAQRIRNDLMQNLETGIINVDYLTQDQATRAGLDPKFVQETKEYWRSLKNKERVSEVIKLMKSGAPNRLEAENLKKGIIDDLVSEKESFASFKGRLKNIGITEEMIKSIKAGYMPIDDETLD